MKILIIHNKYQQSGGEDCVFLNELTLLKENGHIVETVLFDNRTIKSTLDKLLTAVGCIFNFKSYFLIIDKIKRFKPDIIHVHNFFPLISPSVFFAASKCDVPIVLTLHNYRIICPNALLLRNQRPCISCIDKKNQIKGVLCKCYRNSFVQTFIVMLQNFVHSVLLKTWQKHLSRIIVLSEFSKRIFDKSIIKSISGNMIVKPNFTSKYEVKNKRKEDFYIFIGRLSEEKGINVLIEAFRNSELHLKIIGNGPLESEVSNFSKKNNNVETYDFMEKEEMLEFLSRAKALIFPSICFENCPLIILEAFMLGIPVICSDIGGGAELIENGENGLLFSAGKASELIEKVKKIEKDGDLLEKLSSGALKSYKKLYTPESNYLRLIEIYQKTISNYQNPLT